ncbi:hypothetical protein [Paenibacillus validus]|uniref:Uncharacterized protein n=1 Tax=Paenibacillus validus TaxID=44253 RepID=A0A7X2ZBT4_9BACL|nr:hypothetical protein [Paenibacillus validus]MUG71946.1 hypothetical protein [Paenibacillus validus]
MASYTIESLINGDTAIVDNYQNAFRLWQEIWENPESDTADGLARILTVRQITFEHQCGGRWIGQEIMVAVGYGQFYSNADGFGENAERATMVKVAFSRSSCSLEVKGEARRMARIYNLE